MANDWYVSSAAYAGYSPWVTLTPYIIGNIVVPTAPANGAKYVFRCTTAGTSGGTQPSWPTGNNGTVTDGTAHWTNVTGQSAFNWAAAAGDVSSLAAPSFSSRFVAGDRCFLSSDHSESTAVNQIGGFFGGSVYGLIQYICVSRAGSIPPVVADLRTGASITITTSVIFYLNVSVYYYGIAFTVTGSGNNISLQSATFNGGYKDLYFQNCSLNMASATGVVMGTQSGGTIIFDNTTVQFGSTASYIGSTTNTANPNILWINTPSALVLGSVPNVLFSPQNSMDAACRGVDFSSVTTVLVNGNATSGWGGKFLFDSCKIAPGVTRYNSLANSFCELVELINCYDGTNILSESYQTVGSVLTDFTITKTGGATDNVGTFSHKMTTNSNVNKFVNPLNGFWMDTNNTLTGSAKTATVEIVSSTALNNDEISLVLEYEGTSSSSLASFSSTFAGPCATPSAVSTSTTTWNALPNPPNGFASSVSTAQSSANAGSASIFLTKVIVNNNATVSAVWLNVNSGSCANFKVLIYDSSHSALLAQGYAFGILTGGVYRFPLTSNWSATAGTYYVGYVADTGFSAFVDTTQTGQSWLVSGSQSFVTPANPLVGGAVSANGLQVALEFAASSQSSGWGTDYSSNVALSASNTVATFSGSTLSGVRSAVSRNVTGKYYCEVLIGGTVDTTCLIGLQAMSVPANGASNNVYMSIYNKAGSFGGAGVTNGGTPSSWAAGDVIGIAYDASLATVWYNKNNGSWQGGTSPNPATGVGGIPFSTNMSIWPLAVVAMRGASSAAAVYTLQDTSTSQTYSPPSGFTAWATTPVKQHLQVTFTPQVAGRVRGQVRLGRPNTTVYVDPVITIA